jgi:hypothetical protein
MEIDDNGFKFCHINGVIHRENGQAVVYLDGG